MKQDIREMSYVFQKEKQDKDIIFLIDLLLYKEFEKEFDSRLSTNFSTDYVDRIYLELLKDRDGIISYIIENNYNETSNYFGNIFINDTYKLYYLIDNEFLKQLDKCKRYYEKRLNVRNKLKDKDLKEQLISYFEYCFNNCTNNTTDAILKVMSSSGFRDATIDDLNIKIKNYEDFNKIYNKAITDFKKIHKYDNKEEEQKNSGIGLGWTLYATVKAIETLFKL